MTQHNEQTATQSEAVPARIGLDEFVEAVTRGVARALAAQEEVSGYALRQVDQVRPPFTILAGLIAYPPSTFPFPTAAGGSDTTAQRQ